jgi:hypothetical protein
VKLSLDLVPRVEHQEALAAVDLVPASVPLVASAAEAQVSTLQWLAEAAVRSMLTTFVTISPLPRFDF